MTFPMPDGPPGTWSDLAVWVLVSLGAFVLFFLVLFWLGANRAKH